MATQKLKQGHSELNNISIERTSTLFDSRQGAFDEALFKAMRDVPSAQPSGVTTRRLTQDVHIRRLVTHVDGRGTLTELLDPRWSAPGGPITYSYMFSVRPKVVKGWGLHRKHEDRYCLLSGEIDLLLYDLRPRSTTFGELCRIAMHERDRCLVTIPRDVWHADHNIGDRDATVVNFPTRLYDHDDPDKYRLPIDTDLIPYRFPRDVVGG